jgi:dipeptidyl-peptidase-3
VFTTISSSYEECRAESVAMYLSVDKEALAIFGHTDESTEEGTADDIMYIGWLQMCRAGLLALEFYDPAAKKWGQAHMQARYAITRVLLEAGEGLVSIEPHGNGDLRVTLDRSKITTVGKKAMGEFLAKLQVYKATADAQAGRALYDQYTSVPESWIAYRDIVLEKRLPRKLLLQANTFLDGDKVVLKEYSADLPGFIESYLERTI